MEFLRTKHVPVSFLFNLFVFRITCSIHTHWIGKKRFVLSIGRYVIEGRRTLKIRRQYRSYSLMHALKALTQIRTKHTAVHLLSSLSLSYRLIKFFFCLLFFVLGYLWESFRTSLDVDDGISLSLICPSRTMRVHFFLQINRSAAGNASSERLKNFSFSPTYNYSPLSVE